MRWRRREEPCGSHHEDARAEKWESSVAETEELGFAVEANRGKDWGRRRRERLRRDVARRAMLANLRLHVYWRNAKALVDTETDVCSSCKIYDPRGVRSLRWRFMNRFSGDRGHSPTCQLQRGAVIKASSILPYVKVHKASYRALDPVQRLYFR